MPEVEISVLMAVYNTSAYLREAIDSVRHQTFERWELICVDDGSTDDSLSIMNDYARRDPRIITKNQPHAGLASVARNHALQYAQGKFVVMLDSDDYFSPDALERMYARASETEADAVLLDLSLFQNGSSRQIRSWVGLNGDRSAIITGRDAVRLSLDWSIHGLALWRGDIVRAMRYDEVGMNGDELTTRVLFHHCARVAFSSGIYYYRKHAGSTTHTVHLKRLDGLETSRRLHAMLVSFGYDLPTLERSLLAQYSAVKATMFLDKEFTEPDRSEAKRRLRKGFELLREAGIRRILVQRGGIKNAVLAGMLCFPFNAYRLIYGIVLRLRAAVQGIVPRGMSGDPNR